MVPFDRPDPNQRLAHLRRHRAALEAAHRRISQRPRTSADPDRGACLMVLEEELLATDILLHQATAAVTEEPGMVRRPSFAQ